MINIKPNHYAVLFDMDGVLIDSYEPHYLSWAETCDKRGVDMSREQYAGLFGRSFLAFTEALCHSPLTEEQKQEWYEEKEARYREIIEERFPETPGAGDLIRDLHRDGIRMGVASSGPRGNVDCLLRHLTHAEYLSCTISGNDTTQAKPHPEPFLLCAGKLGVPPEKCLVVEDSIHGLQAAQAAGMTAVGLVGTAAREELSLYADHVVDSLKELNPDIVKDLIDRKKRNSESMVTVAMKSVPSV